MQDYKVTPTVNGVKVVLEGGTTSKVIAGTSVVVSSTGPQGTGDVTVGLNQDLIEMTSNLPKLVMTDTQQNYTFEIWQLGGSEVDLLLRDNLGNITNTINMNYDGENEYLSGMARPLGSAIGPRHVFYICNTEVGGFDHRGWVAVNSNRTSGSTTRSPLDVTGDALIEGAITANSYKSNGFTGVTATIGNLSFNNGLLVDSPVIPNTFTSAVAPVKVHTIAAQAISATTYTKLVFGSIDHAPISAAWSAANNRYIAQTSGIFRVSAAIRCTGTARSSKLMIYKNGVLVHSLQDNNTTALTAVSYGGTTDIQLVLNDYIELWIYSSAATTVASSADCHFCVSRIY
jgi:hypothetical protein